MDSQIPIAHSDEARLFIILAAALLLLFIGSFLLDPSIRKKTIPGSSQLVSKPFPAVPLEAKAAYVYDVRTETVLFAKNEDTPLPLASLAKVMSALVAEDLSPLYSIVTVSEEALRAEGDSGLYRDEKWSLKDLLDFSLITSSNDGMRAVALSLGALSRADATSEEIINDFVKEMNRKADELGLESTYFQNETGLDESKVKGSAYGTAKNMNTLLGYVLMNRPALFAATRGAATTLHSLDNRLHVARNTNSIVAEIPGLLVSKTGLTNAAGGNLVIVFDPELGRPIIISILGSTEEGRFKDARALVNVVMAYLTHN